MKKDTSSSNIVKPVKSTGVFGVSALAALKRASRQAREIAKMHGTKIYVVREGKIVAEKP